MDKGEIRREFLKLKQKGFSYAKCKVLLAGQYGYLVSTRTLQRWQQRLNKEDWNLLDDSRRPQTVHTRVTPLLVQQIRSLREATGWGPRKIHAIIPACPVSPSTIKRILRKEQLSKPVKMKGKRIRWVRWQREHPNSLWQIDHSDEQDAAGHWVLSVVDDCSRYSIALVKLKHVTTAVVTHILDELIQKYGKPREILSDNGSAYGLKSKHSKFDRWCKRRGIKHIRASVHSPTTCGKVERLFQTIDQEIAYCNEDLEAFRLRYNHFRPHSSLEEKTPAQIYFGL